MGFSYYLGISLARSRDLRGIFRSLGRGLVSLSIEVVCLLEGRNCLFDGRAGEMAWRLQDSNLVWGI